MLRLLMSKKIEVDEADALVQQENSLDSAVRFIDAEGEEADSDGDEEEDDNDDDGGGGHTIYEPTAHTTVDRMTRSHSEWALQRLLKEMSGSNQTNNAIDRPAPSGSCFSCATFLDAQGNLRVWFWIQRFVPTIHGQNISFEGWYRADKEDKAT
ncbi:hypothetical protein YC2023_098762 [Brassica napus]